MMISLFQADETREEIEVSPEAGVITEQMSTSIKENGGCALIADYGHSGQLHDTFRVIIILHLLSMYFISQLSAH